MGIIVSLFVVVGAVVSVMMRPGTGKLAGGEAQVAAIDFDPPPSGTAAGQPAKPRPRPNQERPNQEVSDQAAAPDEPARDKPPEPAGDVAGGPADDATPAVPRDAPTAVEAEPVHLASVVSLPAVPAGELDGGLGKGGRNIELGSCSEGEARGLTLDLAVPADGMAAAGPRLLVDRVAGDAPRWTIGWKADHAGLGDEKAAVVATVSVVDGRLRLALAGREAARPGLAVLARSVLLVTAPDRSEPHEIGFVKPVGMGAVSADVFGQRPTRKTLPFPQGIDWSHLQRGGCRIDIEVAGEIHPLHIKAGGTPRTVTAECPVLELATGDCLGFNVEVDLPKATLTIKPGVLGTSAKNNWLREFASLVDGGAGAAARCLVAWDKRIEGICGIGLAGAITKPDGERIDEFFSEPFQLPCGYPPLAESARSAFDRHVGSAVGERGPRDTVPRSFDAWRDICRQVLATAREGGGGMTGLDSQWDRTFTQAVRDWWRLYRPELADAVRRLAADLAAARERAAKAKVLRIVTIARSSGGAEYEVPLVRFDEPPPTGDHPPGQASLGLD